MIYNIYKINKITETFIVKSKVVGVDLQKRWEIIFTHY